MVSIKDRKILRQMFSHYDYVMTTAQLSKEKLYYRDIQRMLKAGLIEKVKRGYYHWTMGSGKGDVVIISRLFPDGILYMETALFYYGYSDRNPAEWNIAIDKNASRQRTRIDYPSVKAYRIEPTILSIGATRGEINFTDVRIYDHLGEYESIDELNHLAHVLSDLDQSDIEKFEAVIDSGEYTGSVHDLINLAQNLDCYDFYPGIDSEEALGRVYIEEMEMLDVPDDVLPYFDFEAYGRDARINDGGHFAPGGYVFNNGGKFVERYHGMEDIPPEHRIFAYPKLNIREQMAAYQEVIDRSALNEEKQRLPASREER